MYTLFHLLEKYILFVSENLFHVARLCLKLDKKPANGLIPIPDNLLFDFQMANINRFCNNNIIYIIKNINLLLLLHNCN
jgi:hypothetical protein